MTAKGHRPTCTSAAGAIPPHAYFLVSAVFHYLGPAFAVLLFAHVGVLGVAWPRIASAAVIGFLVLRQVPTPAEIAGVALVVCGVAAHQERDTR